MVYDVLFVLLIVLLGVPVGWFIAGFTGKELFWLKRRFSFSFQIFLLLFLLSFFVVGYVYDFLYVAGSFVFLVSILIGSYFRMQ